MKEVGFLLSGVGFGAIILNTLMKLGMVEAPSFEVAIVAFGLVLVGLALSLTARS